MKAVTLTVNAVDATSRLATFSGELDDLRTVAGQLGGSVFVTPGPVARPDSMAERSQAVLRAVALLDFEPLTIRISRDGPTEIQAELNDLVRWADRWERQLEKRARDSVEYPAEFFVDLCGCRVFTLTNFDEAERLGSSR